MSKIRSSGVIAPPADIDRPSTWSKFRQQMCTGCWSGCCTLPVEVKITDLLRLGLISEDEALMSPKKIATRLIKSGHLQAFRARTGLYTLAQKSDRACVFLSPQRTCTVYDKRPEVCRRFPDIGPRPGYCPHRNR